MSACHAPLRDCCKQKVQTQPCLLSFAVCAFMSLCMSRFATFCHSLALPRPAPGPPLLSSGPPEPVYDIRVESRAGAANVTFAVPVNRGSPIVSYTIATDSGFSMRVPGDVAMVCIPDLPCPLLRRGCMACLMINLRFHSLKASAVFPFNNYKADAHRACIC